MLTYRNTTLRIISRDTVAVEGNGVAEDVRCTWDANGARLDPESLRRLKPLLKASWSDDEMGELAYHAETLLDQAYTKAYDIVIYEGFNQDRIHVLESIRVDDDAAANAYAEQHYSDQEWYVLDSTGRDINGGVE